MKKNIRQITEVLHTIFCRRQHEADMINYMTTDKCCYYLETSIEDTWEQKDHKRWLEQAEVFLAISNEDGLELLQSIVSIYKAASFLRAASPLYMRYVKLLIEEELK